VTPNDMFNRALVELQSDGSRALETGQTLLGFLQQSLTLVADDVFDAWVFEWSFTTQPPMNTQLGVAVYNVPDEVIEVIDIVLDTGAIDTRKLRRLPLRTFRYKWAALKYLPMDKPIEWCQLSDTQFMVAPRPNNSVYTMTVEGASRVSPVDPSNYGVEFPIMPSRHHESIVYGLALRGAEALKDYGLVEKMTTRYKEIVNRMITEDKRQPDTEYEFKPFRAQPVMYTTDYWANPFVRDVN